MAAPTYQQLIQMLSKAESEAGEGATSVAELLAAMFSHRFPHIRVGRPGRFLETVRRIAGPIKHQRLHGSTRRSYLKRRWTPRTRNTMYLGVCECHIICMVYSEFLWNNVMCGWCALKGNIPFWWLYFHSFFARAGLLCWLVHGTYVMV